MLIIAMILCIAVVVAGLLVKRARDRAVLERHGITPEDLHNLLASHSNVALFDVRLPLDLLTDSVLIPGATRLAPAEVVANPGLFPQDRDSIVYCTCPSDETSRRILRRALAAGLQRVRFLKGGLDAWKAKGYPVEPYHESFHLGWSATALPQQDPAKKAAGRVHGTAAGQRAELRSR
jgi:rhodanese-related sulfurtransferase